MNLLKMIFGENPFNVTDYDWEYIGHTGLGSEDTDNIPRWVLRAYSKCEVHHDGVIYRFNGKSYHYKVVESGQGASSRLFYRRRKRSYK